MTNNPENLERSQHQQKVDQFMILAKQNLPQSPTIPNDQIRKLRAKLIIEEALETIQALGCTLFIRSTQDTYPINTKAFKLGISFIESTHQPDLVEIVDGCCDLKVVTTGTLSACGINDIQPQKLVDENNLEKFGPGHSYREDGKLVKPPTHKPPNLKAELERQSSLNKIETQCLPPECSQEKENHAPPEQPVDNNHVILQNFHDKCRLCCPHSKPATTQPS